MWGIIPCFFPPQNCNIQTLEFLNLFIFQSVLKIMTENQEGFSDMNNFICRGRLTWLLSCLRKRNLKFERLLDLFLKKSLAMEFLWPAADLFISAKYFNHLRMRLDHTQNTCFSCLYWKIGNSLGPPHPYYCSVSTELVNGVEALC